MAAPARARQTPVPDDDLWAVAPAFDHRFYRAVNRDVPVETDPLWHYRMAGWREGRDPAPWFSVRGYLKDHPDVEAMGVDPLVHFVTAGRHEGREVRPSQHAAAYIEAADWEPTGWSCQAFDPAAAEEVEARAHEIPDSVIRAAVATEFDPAYYLATNPDVAEAGADPLDHFLFTGWSEGRDPTAWFSLFDYTAAYSDIGGINPFAHYLLTGRAEGRVTREALGFRYDLIARQKPVARRIADSVAASKALLTQPAASLVDRFHQARTGLKHLHITFSHDNYADSLGGLQMSLRREGMRFIERGVDHLHLYPAAAWQLVRRDDEPGPLGVLLNGRRLGTFAPATVREALAQALPRRAGRRSFAIHSLLGHGVADTLALLRTAGMSAGYFWLHDFASLCAGVHLQRNDIEDCAAPPPDSPACGVCAYGPFRARHMEAHRALFEALAITVVAPSQTTLDFWRARGDLPARDMVVLPHARLVDGQPARKEGHDHPFRLAYLGMPSPLKGWPIFRELSERLAGDPRYQFLHLGARSDPTAANVAFHRVVVNGEQPDAMRDALEILDVDAALIWPLCRETFSLTAYEAASAGAAVITGPDSGNVAAFAAEPGRGAVLADETALHDAFASGEVLALARAARSARRYGLAYSGMTADLVDA